MTFKTIKDIDVKGKRIILRADLNVPRQSGAVTDTTRIDRLKPTIDYLRAEGARVMIISHFGRPKGSREPEMSLAFLAPILEKQWSTKVSFCHYCIGDNAIDTAQKLKDGDVVLMENVRYHPEETKNDAAFAKALAELGDIYVNDAFSTSHRAHASTVGITEHLPSVAGLLMAEELNALRNALDVPEKPVLAVVGGSKVSTKLAVLENLMDKVDYLVLGGGMANTFLYANGVSIGKSLCETDMADTAKAIMDKAVQSGCQLILPQDVVVVTELHEDAPHKTVDINDIPDDHMVIDVGDKTIKALCDTIQSVKTVVWNGPLGVFEIRPFDIGTNKVAQWVADRSRQDYCVSVAGGGDTVAALDNAGALEYFTYISTAGGAFLEWLEGKELPGVKALTA